MAGLHDVLDAGLYVRAGSIKAQVHIDSSLVERYLARGVAQVSTTDLIREATAMALLGSKAPAATCGPKAQRLAGRRGEIRCRALYSARSMQLCVGSAKCRFQFASSLAPATLALARTA